MRDDGQRIAEAIAYLESEYRRQPSLDEVAAAVGLSPYHFQRLFSRWAGVSPKRFLQFLTVTRAKSALREGRSVLDSAYEAGLSGPGRLHDLFVTLEAVTPGEYKSLGHGIEIRWGRGPSPFGPCTIGITTRGVCKLAFVEDPEVPMLLAEMATDWPGARLVEDQGAAAETLRQVFVTPPEQGQPLSVVVRGTNFQVRVWEALLRIPSGSLATYGDVARCIGHPAATRAVGTAVGRNPVAYLVPCHRVIRGTGVLGNYRWGSHRKKAMVGWEAAQREVASVRRS
jgi:AraC family transcriptional regulator of adaptative response/methylated-DNA-[protein]-cysteine methyltransferase